MAAGIQPDEIQLLFWPAHLHVQIDFVEETIKIFRCRYGRTSRSIQSNCIASRVSKRNIEGERFLVEGIDQRTIIFSPHFPTNLEIVFGYIA